MPDKRKEIRFPNARGEKRKGGPVLIPRFRQWEEIEAWLEDEGITFETVKDFNSHYHIAANMKNVQVHLSESKVRRGVLAVQAVVALDEQQVWKAEQIKKKICAQSFWCSSSCWIARSTTLCCRKISSPRAGSGYRGRSTWRS